MNSDGPVKGGTFGLLKRTAPARPRANWCSGSLDLLRQPAALLPSTVSDPFL